MREVRGGLFVEDALAVASDQRGATDNRGGESVRAVGGCPPDTPGSSNGLPPVPTGLFGWDFRVAGFPAQIVGRGTFARSRLGFGDGDGDVNVNGNGNGDGDLNVSGYGNVAFVRCGSMGVASGSWVGGLA